MKYTILKSDHFPGRPARPARCLLTKGRMACQCTSAPQLRARSADARRAQAARTRSCCPCWRARRISARRAPPARCLPALASPRSLPRLGHMRSARRRCRSCPCTAWPSRPSPACAWSWTSSARSKAGRPALSISMAWSLCLRGCAPGAACVPVRPAPVPGGAESGVAHGRWPGPAAPDARLPCRPAVWLWLARHAAEGLLLCTPGIAWVAQAGARSSGPTCARSPCCISMASPTSYASPRAHSPTWSTPVHARPGGPYPRLRRLPPSVTEKQCSKRGAVHDRR